MSFCSIPDIGHPVLSGGAVTAMSRGGEGIDPEERVGLTVGGATELATLGPDQQRRGCRYVQPKGSAEDIKEAKNKEVLRRRKRKREREGLQE